MKSLRIIISAICIAIIASLSATAKPKAVAVAPDMEKIKAETLNPGSRYYYPKLMASYEKNDTALKLEDYRRLYLGYVFQEDYNPYRRLADENSLEQLYFKKSHTRDELKAIRDHAEAALDNDPFDLQQMNYLIYALRNLGKINLANIWQYRLNHLLEAILSTGTGLDSANGWIVIDPKHEYTILNFKGLVAKEATYMPPYCEFITVEQKDAPNSDKSTEGYYFNIRYILEEYYRKHPDQMQD